SSLTVADHFADPAAAKLLGEISILLQFPTRARQSVPGTNVLSFLLPFYSQVKLSSLSLSLSLLHPTSPSFSSDKFHNKVRRDLRLLQS
ncbi:unnamed protein product, partial [Linum tenue]